MKSSRLKEDENIEENIIKDVKNLFRLKKLKKETNVIAIKDIGNILRFKKKKKLKDRILRDIRNSFEHVEEEENYYKPVTVSNFLSNNYIEYESKGIEIKLHQLKNVLTKLDHT